MALHPKFPRSPYAILDPDLRWFPADEALREKDYGKLLPPLVAKLRKEVKKWRDSGYAGASATSSSLLNWWFKTDHPMPQNDGTTSLFQYYFAQREAIETIIYLHEIVRVKDKYDLMRFDSSGILTAGMFPESWRRYVVKMATGSGKTKAMSLVLAWCFFHKLYEEESTLARNFLIIAPNIIVLERLRHDFDGLKIFFQDPVLPENGHEGRNWRDDFQLTLHIQDNLGTTRKTGNIFLTNIHRVYESSQIVPSAQDENTMAYFLGAKPTGATTDSKIDLEQIVRDIDELVILNDEAHHIHDERMAWFKSIEDIHNRLKMKGDELALQVDVTATPKHNDGSIFVQTICDYPLVEAIHQDVVKHPVVPDEASRSKLQEEKSSKFSEKYRQYIHLGVIEWRKVYIEHAKVGKKAVLFLMTDDTKNCDEVAEYLSNTYPEFQGKDSVLVIHTKNNGEISESQTGKNKEELEKLRKLSNEIDKTDNPYKAIISVLMLKEGWDVRNVTTIVGLRAYSAQSNILPEQTLGRGLRRMYFGQDVTEYVSVVGTDAFMNFVESIRAEGVELERRKMGEGTAPKAPIVIEIDNENTKKDIVALDIEIPVLSPRIYREYKNLSNLKIDQFGHKKIGLKQFSKEEQKEIIFRDISNGEITHKTLFDANFVPDYQSVVGYFTQTIMKELRLFSGFDVLFGKVRNFIVAHLFENEVNLNDLNTLRNLSELEATKTIIETFKKEINILTVLDKGESEIRDTIKISKCRPFVAKDQGFLIPKKSPFNKIIGDSHFELEFASFLEGCEDIVSYAKNYFAVHLKIDYKDADGFIRDFYPDFVVKKSLKELWIVETKGREDLDDIEKIKRLAQWCDDLNKVQSKIVVGWLYVKQEAFERYTPKNFEQLISSFQK
ncbi:MAG: type III restriction endonuclease subunit R [Deltaproteobacteria bacterium RIFCSPLOWO2_01_44_7]|nr:MAG: type III restriction endonuclease subunit R [Deltaproteobacteria bacterium RIFCSPHIGHO2_01_FULL_43_49]OGQ14214.1 MAG: type III restriction endonuclease subunit R [Deltaproteobacteria bacterium RIFCSPHIGHO2_02_FULL_44_53]OGQ27430.1 MAG: type III restriction endonuclease subunit R [Deltaproteobacteria bacterium RIFCSPHIGHO2_12_FULL_44_21]OGQ30678.1 MAG: type III restriction endonuclease subunit R [Deltaproteobacteria bacterium RIFCSPLOWO2_01_FULL_45_74]OGQ37733.1 MAG: type III restriction